MIALLQRVSEAQVRIAGDTVGAIGPGLLVFWGVERDDDAARMQRLVDKTLRYRVFADADGRMNRSLLDVQGELLLVSQFTLPADTRKGTRASFTSAAGPDKGRDLYEAALARFRESGLTIACGEFGADMQVALVNDGPVTFWLQS